MRFEIEKNLLDIVPSKEAQAIEDRLREFCSTIIAAGIEEGLGNAKIEIDGMKEILADKEEENKKLKSDLAFKNTMLDNVKAEYESSQNVIKKLNKELDFQKKQNLILINKSERLTRELEELKK